MQSNGNGKIANAKYAEHILECAAIAKQAGDFLGLRDDAARQACFATVCIDAKGHGVFLEPTPRDTKTPVIQPEPAAASNTTKEGGTSEERDEAAAAKADAQIPAIAPNPTPELADGVKRTTLLEAIEKGRSLLNKSGYTPVMTGKSLNEIINGELGMPGNLGTLDTDQLEIVAKMLMTRLDIFKSNMKALEADAPF